jgi:hypothetical protein
MLEPLGPVVSLYKLLLEGLSKASKAIKDNKKKAIQRKIIEIQLSLEEIIDNSQEILSFMERFCHENKANQNIIHELKRLLYRQHQRICILLEQINDHNSGEIMKLFAPEIRRNIIGLIHIKGGFIQEFLQNKSYFENIKISKNQLITNIHSALLDWNHDSFISEGHSYIRSLYANLKKSDIIISKRLQEQKQVVDALIECSKGLSEFIKKDIGIEEFFGSTNLKSN